MTKQKFYECPTCGYPLTDGEVSGEMKHWCEVQHILERKIKEFEAQICELETESKSAQIILPKITEEMVDLLHPELIEVVDGKYNWTQLAVDAAACFEIRSE